MQRCKIGVLTIVFGSILIYASCAVSPVNLSRHYHKMLPACVTVNWDGMHCGSGTVIDKENGFILIANHMVDGAPSERFEIRFLNGESIPAKVYAHDPNCDSALLQVDPNELSRYDIPEVRFQKDVCVGEPIFTIGSLYSFDGIITHGILSRGITFAEEDYWSRIILGFYFADYKSGPGNSGAPVFNLDDKIIGMHVGWRGNYQRGDHLPVVIPSYSIMKFLDANGVFYNE